MKDAKTFETKMEVPSAKRHSVFAPFGFVLTTFRWHTLGSASALTGAAAPISLRTLAANECQAK
jgi:hypothetical protein